MAKQHSRPPRRPQPGESTPEEQADYRQALATWQAHREQSRRLNRRLPPDEHSFRELLGPALWEQQLSHEPPGQTG